jgi:hypothetical protein
MLRRLVASVLIVAAVAALHLAGLIRPASIGWKISVSA